MTPHQEASVSNGVNVDQATDHTESERSFGHSASDENTVTLTENDPSANDKVTGFGQSFFERTNGKDKLDSAHVGQPVLSNNPVILKTPVQHGDLAHSAYMLYAKNQVMVLFNPGVANDIGAFFAGCRTFIHEDISLREAVKFLGIDPDFVADFDSAMHTVTLGDHSVAKLIEDSRKPRLFRDHRAIRELCATTCEKMDEIRWDRDASRACHTQRHMKSDDRADRFVMAKPIPKQATVQGQAWGVNTSSIASENYTLELPQTLDAVALENRPWDQYGASPQSARSSKMV